MIRVEFKLPTSGDATNVVYIPTNSDSVAKRVFLRDFPTAIWWKAKHVRGKILKVKVGDLDYRN